MGFTDLTVTSVVITGPSEGGIGAATVIALAHGKPKAIFLAGRDRNKALSVIDEIKKIDGTIQTIFVELDLADQKSIRQAAKAVLNSEHAHKIHCLINNAGIMAVMPYSTTTEGIEL